MAILRPFRALRPARSELAPLIASVPYDVVNREEAAQLAQGKPLSFLHVSRPEIDLPPGTDPYSSAVYSRARENLEALTRQAPLLRETEPKLYVYRLIQRLNGGSHQQTGIAATFSIDEYDDNKICKHEKTRKDKEDDRTRHVLTLNAQTGPVFLAYRGQAEINAEVSRVMNSARPLFDFQAEDGVQHTLWAMPTSTNLPELFRSIPRLYIADGHHRAASAARARAELKRNNPRHTGTEDYNFFLAVAFPAEELRILPYHRLVLDLNGLTEAEFLSKISGRFELTENGGTDPARGQFAMFLSNRWIGLKPKAGTIPAARDSISALDVSVLQNHLLEPILGIDDPRTNQRIEFVGGIRGTGELVRKVRDGSAAVAFSLHPTTLQDLMDVSDAGEIMPPKSTWFEPKLRDGLLSHVLG